MRVRPRPQATRSPRSLCMCLWLLIVGPLLGGCIDDDRFDNDIDFSVTCDQVDCGNADSADIDLDTNPQLITCQWDCIDFEGHNNDFVILTFEREAGQCWSRTDTFRAEGLCF
jgi:hypothetical protein